MRRVRLVLALILGFAALWSPLPGQTGVAVGAASPLRRGVLPNGLRYAVLPHASPRGDVSLRLVVQAGSLDERDDERGFAHFVEHMAFNGTRHHPAGSLRNYFQRLGLTFGADLNASTSYTHTTYLLDLPDGLAGKIEEALGVLRDYADGILFEPQEVTREAGVVISELRARDSAGRRAAIGMLEALYSGTPLPAREVGGDQAQLAAATSAQLRAFYQRNYQPARMTVIVVGPVEPAAAIGQITAAFGSVAVPAEPVASAAAPLPPPFPGAKPAVTEIPTANAARFDLVFIAPRPPDTPEGHRQELVQRTATAVLHQRLRERREGDLATFGDARAGFDASPIGALVHHTIGVSTSVANWSDAVQLAETEVRRARTMGVTQAEVDEAIAGQLTSARNRIASLTGQTAARVATDLARFASLNRVWQTPEADFAETSRALQGLTAAEATAALGEIYPGDGLNLILGVPPKTEIRPDRVFAIYTRSTTRSIRRGSDEDEQLVFRYQNLGPAGALAKREHVADLDLTLAAFDNGVRVNVRPTKFEPERFRLRVVFPLNLSNVPHDAGGIADLAGHLLLQSDLKQHKQTELSRLIRLHGIAPAFSVSQGTPVLTLSGPVTELAFALQFLTALLSELELDQEHYRVALNRYYGQYQSISMNAGPLALTQALRVYLGNDPRSVMLHPQVFGRMDPGVTERWLREHMLQVPVEIGIVGDFTSEAALQAAAASVGTLKRRRPPPKAGKPLVGPTKSSRQEGTAELPASTSMSCVLWPVTLPDNPRQNAALALATDVLRDRLMVVLREALGLTYSPDARTHRDLIQRDFAFAAMINTFDPARARQLTEGCVRLATRLAEQGVTPDEFARLREPARTRYAEHLRNNAWWLNSVVSLAQSRPEVLEEARVHAAIVDQLTLEEVNLAAQVFRPDKMTVMILRPASAGGPATGKAGPGQKAADPTSGRKR